MQVFLSSTYIDLVEHRKAALEALERLGHGVNRMEIFGARPMEPVVACLEEVDKSDLFLGIYAHRYGYVPPGSRRSITEKEFERALKMGKPLVCFVVDDACKWREEHIEEDPGKTRLMKFKNRIRRTLVTDSFCEPLHLALKVATSIGRHINERPELRVARVDSGRERPTHEELVTLLEQRKEGIVSELAAKPELKRRFLQFHRKNLTAIRSGQLLLSHLLTGEIHSLLHKHNCEAFSAEQIKSLQPGVQYCLMSIDEGGRRRSQRQYPSVEALEPISALGPKNHTHDLPSSLAESDSIDTGQDNWQAKLLEPWLQGVLTHYQKQLTHYREQQEQRAKADRGHDFGDGVVCRKCGCSLEAAAHFGFACRG